MQFNGELDKDELRELASRKFEEMGKYPKLDSKNWPWREVFYIVKRRHTHDDNPSSGTIRKSSPWELSFTGSSDWAYFRNYWYALACSLRLRSKDHD